MGLQRGPRMDRTGDTSTEDGGGKCPHPDVLGSVRNTFISRGREGFLLLPLIHRGMTRSACLPARSPGRPSVRPETTQVFAMTALAYPRE